MTTALPKPYTVLLVDDDIHNQRIFDTILRHNGFTVRMAASGDEALREAREHLPDLILMDLHMPSVDGIEGLRRLKADERTASIPVIMLTTETDFLKRSQCRALGCVEFLNKPIGKEALGSAIRRWLVK